MVKIYEDNLNKFGVEMKRHNCFLTYLQIRELPDAAFFAESGRWKKSVVEILLQALSSIANIVKNTSYPDDRC